MIEAALRDNASLLLLFAVLALAAGVPAWRLGRKHPRGPLPAVGSASSAALVLAVTLQPLHPGAPATRVCTVQQDLWGAVLAEQGLLNVALFIPLAFFLALLTRRPVTVLAGAVVLSGAIEIAQALIPGMGRACDSGDLAANALGALLGCLAAYAGRSLTGQRRAPATVQPSSRRADLRSAWVVALPGAGLLAAVALPWLLFTSSAVSDDHRADAAQTRAAGAAVREYFGESVSPTKVQYMPGSYGRSGRLDVATPSGNLVMDWPSREIRSGQLAAAAPDPAGAPPLGEEDARATASAFARAHFPWAPPGETARTTAAGGPDSQAKLVSWRSRVDEVLMPMRLDIIVGGDHRILAFSATETAPPQLPKPVVTQEQAQEKARAAHPGMEVSSSELIAKQDAQGTWRVCWMVSLTPGNAPGTAPATPPKRGMLGVALDAVTGVPFTGAELSP